MIGILINGVFFYKGLRFLWNRNKILLMIAVCMLLDFDDRFKAFTWLKLSELFFKFIWALSLLNWSNLYLLLNHFWFSYKTLMLFFKFIIYKNRKTKLKIKLTYKFYEIESLITF